MKKNTLKRFRRKSKNGGKKRISNKNKRLGRKTQKIRGGESSSDIFRKGLKFLGKKVGSLRGTYKSHNNGMDIEQLIQQLDTAGTQQNIERNELHRLLTTTNPLPQGITIDASVKTFYIPDDREDKSANNTSYKYKWACAESLYDKLSHEDKSTLPLHDNTRFYSFALSKSNLERIEKEYYTYLKQHYEVLEKFESSDHTRVREEEQSVREEEQRIKKEEFVKEQEYLSEQKQKAKKLDDCLARKIDYTQCSELFGNDKKICIREIQEQKITDCNRENPTEKKNTRVGKTNNNCGF